MMDVTVKTLDGQNRNYSLPENITVREFKDRISNSINIPAETQRLIFHGKVMADEKMLKEYDVHGKVIHVVQRAPPSSRSGTTSSSTTSSGAGSGQGQNSVLVGSFTLPTEALDANQVQNIVQQAVAGMGDNWRNARVSTRSSTDGSSLDVHINLGQIPSSAVPNGAQQRLTQARQMLGLAREAVLKLENSPGEQDSDETRDENQNRETAPPRSANDSTEDSDMDTSSPNGTRAEASQSEARDESDGEASEGATAAPDSQSARTANGAGRRESNAPPLSSMSSLLGEVMELNDRLVPHVERLRSIMSEDAEGPSDQLQEPQRTFNFVSEALHAMSHSYHNLSDLIVDMTTPPPRRLYTTPSPGVLPGLHPHQGIPVRAQFSVGSPRVVRRVVTTQAHPEAPSAPPTAAATPSAPPTASTTATTTAAAATTQASGTSQARSGTANGSDVPPGFVSAASTNPYVYVEVGPDSVTVNSISAHVITTENNGERPNGRSTDSTTVTSSSTSSSVSSTTSATSTAAPTTPSTTTAPSQASPSAPPTTQATPSAPPPPMAGLAGMNIPGLPPDMMQNIISSVLQQHGHRQGQPVQINVIPMPMSGIPGGIPGGINIPGVPPAHGSTPTTSSSTASATPTAPTPAANVSSTSTASTAAATSTTTSSSGNVPGPQATAQAQAQAQAQNLLGPMLLGDRGVPQPVDRFLPCTSHHFLAQRTRSMATQTNQAPENALSEMVSSLMSGLLGNVHQAPPPPAPATVAPGGPTSTRPAAQGASFSRATTHTTSAQQGPISAIPFASLLQGGGFGPIPGMPRPPAPSGQSGGMPGFPMMQVLRDMLQSGQPAPSQGGTQPQGAMSDDAFARLVSGIGGYLTRAATGEQANDTVHDFLSTLGDNYTSSSDESFLNDVFQCLSRHITFTDLFQIFVGNPVPLNRLRTPLQEFIQQRVLNGETYSERSLNAGVERILDDMQSEIDAAVAVVTVKPNIDLNGTLRNLFRRNLVKIMRQIMDSPVHDANFGANLHSNVRHLLEEFVVLTPDCLAEGSPAFERMLNSRLQHMTAGMNPMIQHWMVNMTSQQLQNFRTHISVSRADVQQYVVRPQTPASGRSDSPMETDSAPTVTAASPSASKKPTIPPKPTSIPPRVTRASSTTTSPATAEQRGKRTFMNGAGSDGASPSHSASPTSPPSVEDESWQGVVPSDWVPIINRDINRQRQNGAPHPLSDVYMQGMPPKRRRMMSNDRPGNLNNMTDYIPETIKRAASAVGVQPISSLENLSTEAAEDSDLHLSLENEVQRVLNQRLQNDSDYNSDKFPNSKELFKKGHP